LLLGGSLLLLLRLLTGSGLLLQLLGVLLQLLLLLGTLTLPGFALFGVGLRFSGELGLLFFRPAFRV
jgi:hypothetical protein